MPLQTDAPRRLALALFATALLLACLAPGAASAANVYVTGERVGGPGTACQGGNNAENDHVRVCFQPTGDWLYVNDAAPDGRSAFGQFTNRDRVCRNPYGSGTWARCNYEFREGSVVLFRGFTRDTEGLVNWMRDKTLHAQDLA